MISTRFRVPRSLWAIALVFSLSCAAAACDEKPPGQDSSPSKKKDRKAALQERSAPSFDWRRALESTPSSAEDAGGLFVDGCASDDDRETDETETARPTPESHRTCRRPSPSSADRWTYHVSEVTYAEGRTRAVRLIPHIDLEVGVSALEHFDLPEFPVQRSRWSERNSKTRRIVSFRLDRLDPALSPGTPIGVDLVSADDAPNVLHHATVYAFRDDVAWLESLRLDGPPSASPRLVLAGSMARGSPFADVVVEFRLDATELRRWTDYSLRPPEASRPVPRLQLPDDADGAPGDTTKAWADGLEQFVETLEESSSETPTQTARPVFGLAANQTTPVGRIEEVVLALEQLTDPEYQLLVGPLDSLDLAASREGPVRALNVDVRSGPPSATTDRTGSTFLHLTVRVTLEGFRLEAGQRELPPIDGCPDPGPTICLADPEFPVHRRLERAASRQSSESIDASIQDLSSVVWAYDWAALHRNVRRIQQQYEGAGYIHISAAPGVPAAVLVRTFDVTGLQFGTESGEDCPREFQSNAEFREARPCMDADGELRRLFGHPIWRLR